MLPYELIRSKRDGAELHHDDIKQFIENFISGEVPDYQMAAFLMAVYFRGMTPQETLALTEAYIASGETLDFSHLAVPTSDKHSTGGVGDKVSLVLAPLVAAAGVAVPMISGRGLGHTGGTLDKLESIPDFQTSLSPARCNKILRDVGFFIAAQSEKVVPADRKIYALRDVTATVESIPLIVASIMSKKLAEGTGSLVLDVKFGNGAFMQTMTDAETLAQAMVNVGNLRGVPTAALLTDMNQPLGEYVGNSLEVLESILYLRGELCPPDLDEITMALGSLMLVLSNVADDFRDGCKKLKNALRSGNALKKFEEFIKAQGGNPNVVHKTEILPQAPVSEEFCATDDGWVAEFNTFGIGMLAVEMGAGRKRIDDEIDHRVGFRFLKKIGEKVRRGEPVAVVFARDDNQAKSALAQLGKLIKFSTEKVSKKKLLQKIIHKNVEPFSWDAKIL